MVFWYNITHCFYDPKMKYSGRHNISKNITLFYIVPMWSALRVGHYKLTAGSIQMVSYNVLTHLVLLFKVKYPQNCPHYIILNISCSLGCCCCFSSGLLLPAVYSQACIYSTLCYVGNCLTLKLSELVTYSYRYWYTVIYVVCNIHFYLQSYLHQQPSVLSTFLSSFFQRTQPKTIVLVYYRMEHY